MRARTPLRCRWLRRGPGGGCSAGPACALPSRAPLSRPLLDRAAASRRRHPDRTRPGARASDGHRPFVPAPSHPPTCVRSSRLRSAGTTTHTTQARDRPSSQREARRTPRSLTGGHDSTNSFHFRPADEERRYGEIGRPGSVRSKQARLTLRKQLIDHLADWPRGVERICPIAAVVIIEGGVSDENLPELVGRPAVGVIRASRQALPQRRLVNLQEEDTLEQLPYLGIAGGVATQEPSFPSTFFASTAARSTENRHW